MVAAYGSPPRFSHRIGTMLRSLRVSSCALLAVTLAVPALASAQAAASARPSAPTQPKLGAHGVPIVSRDGLRFKDLNRSGSVDPYEDWRLTPEARARDLVSRMTLDGEGRHDDARDRPRHRARWAPRASARATTPRRTVA